MIAILFALLIAHAISDYPLQGEFLAKAKNHTLSIVPGESVWVSTLLAHCLIHAGAVWIITGSALIGVTELVCHFVIDHCKCRGWYGFNADQALHAFCKLIYAAVLFS